MGNLITFHAEVAEGVKLQTSVYEPVSGKYPCTIIFSPGLCTNYQVYHEMLSFLSDSVRVVAYNYRGHGSSGGVFKISSAVKDLESLVRMEKGPTFLMGHSAGAGISATVQYGVRGHILLCPYLDFSHLAIGQYYILSGLSHLSFLGRHVDNMLYRSGLSGLLGLADKMPLSDLLEMTKMRSPKKSRLPALWMISDRDEIIGTLGGKDCFALIHKSLKGVYSRGVDRSDIISGLNHLFNIRAGDLFHIFNGAPLIPGMMSEAILDFCRSNL